jgi:hypothetical protein
MKGPTRAVSRRRGAAAFALLAAILLAPGCYNPFDPAELTGGISTPPPAPDTPSNIVRLLEWCYNNRAIAEYRELFTDDYRFQFGALDPYGNAYRNDPWTREDEMISATKLFQGASDKQAAASITLQLDRNFQVRSDPRPGKNSRWHRTIRTSHILSILDASQLRTDVTGFSLFFLVRGDSALIPQELIDRGFGPDSTRWYIDRWEDESAQTPGSSLAPAGAPAFRSGATPGATTRAMALRTWGFVKVFWR